MGLPRNSTTRYLGAGAILNTGSFSIHQRATKSADGDTLKITSPRLVPVVLATIRGPALYEYSVKLVFFIKTLVKVY